MLSPHAFAVIACVGLAAAASRTSVFDLVDLTETEAARVHQFMEDRRACFDELNDELQAQGVPRKYLVLGSDGKLEQLASVPKLSELQLVRNTTLRVYRIASARRGAIEECIDRSDCGWIVRHINALCRRDDDTDELVRIVSDDSKLASALVQAVSAFFLLDGRSLQARQLATAPRSDGTTASSQLADAARRRALSLWSHPIAYPAKIEGGNVDLDDFLASVASKSPALDVRSAREGIRKVEASVTQFAIGVYAHFPFEIKVVAMAAANDAHSRLRLLHYVKDGTDVIPRFVRSLGLTAQEVGDVRAFARGDDGRFDAVAELLLRRLDNLDAEERRALKLVMQETLPLLRMQCALLKWAHARYAAK